MIDSGTSRRKSERLKRLGDHLVEVLSRSDAQCSSTCRLQLHACYVRSSENLFGSGVYLVEAIGADEPLNLRGYATSATLSFATIRSLHRHARAGSRVHRGRASSRRIPSHSAVVLLENEQDRVKFKLQLFRETIWTLAAVLDQMRPIRQKAVAICVKKAHGWCNGR